MTSEVTLTKTTELPQFLQGVFNLIDARDFESLEAFFADDFVLYFAHWKFQGFKQGVGFVGAFDRRLPKYEHVMGEIFVSENLTIFDGTLRVWLEDGTVVETPFWDKIQVDPVSGRISTMYALFSIAAVPDKFWADLDPADFL